MVEEALAQRVGLSSSADVSFQARFLPFNRSVAFTVSIVFSFRQLFRTKPA